MFIFLKICLFCIFNFWIYIYEFHNFASQEIQFYMVGILSHVLYSFAILRFEVPTNDPMWFVFLKYKSISLASQK
jgi:hypothetical protein